MDKINSVFSVTLCAAAHVEIETDVRVEVQGSSVSAIYPVDPDLGIGNAIILLKDGTSLNVLQTPEQIMNLQIHWN